MHLWKSEKFLGSTRCSPYRESMMMPLQWTYFSTSGLLVVSALKVNVFNRSFKRPKKLKILGNYFSLKELPKLTILYFLWRLWSDFFEKLHSACVDKVKLVKKVRNVWKSIERGSNQAFRRVQLVPLIEKCSFCVLQIKNEWEIYLKYLDRDIMRHKVSKTELNSFNGP